MEEEIRNKGDSQTDSNACKIPELEYRQNSEIKKGRNWLVGG